MKTNIPVDLTDDQRNTLAIYLDRKRTARKVTRREVCQLVWDYFDALLEAAAEQPAPTSTRVPAPLELPEDERALVAELQAAGRSASYIVGSLVVFRRVRGRPDNRGRF